METLDLRSAAKNFSWLLGDKIFRFVVTAGVNAVLARKLGTENWGTLAYTTSLLALFGFLAMLGIDQWVVAKLISNPKTRDRTLTAVAVIRLTGAAIAIGAALLWSGVSTNDRSLLLFGIWGVLGTALDFPDLYFQSQNKSKYSVFSKGIAFSIANALRIAGVFLGASLGFYVAIVAVEAIVTGSLQLFLLKTKTRERPNFSHIRNDTIQLAKQSWPLGLSSLLVLSYSKLDLILINSLGSPNETGIYAAGSKILEYLGVFPSIFSISILPLIFSVFRNHEAGSQKERERVSMAIGVANILAWIIPIAMYALAPWIITLLYGTAFREAVSILRTIVWIFPLTLFGVVRQGFLLLNEKLSICIALEALTLALLVGFNYLLIPKHGAQGSATALLLTSLMVNIAAIVVSKSVRNIAKFYIKSIWSCRRFRLTNIKRCVESLGIFKPH